MPKSHSSPEAKLRRRLVRRIRNAGLRVQRENHVHILALKRRRTVATFRVDLLTAYCRPADVATVAGIVDCNRMRLGLWKIVY